MARPFVALLKPLMTKISRFRGLRADFAYERATFAKAAAEAIRLHWNTSIWEFRQYKTASILLPASGNFRHFSTPVGLQRCGLALHARRHATGVFGYVHSGACSI